MLIFCGFRSRQALALAATIVTLSLWVYDSVSLDHVLHVHPSFGSHSSSNMSLSNIFFPVPDQPTTATLMRENNKMLNALVTCVEHGNCHRNQTKVVLLAASAFREYLQGTRGGEAIWAHSTSLALTNMGYTTIHIPHPSIMHVIQFYQVFPDIVKVVIMDEKDVFSCHKDGNCIASESNPVGIPSWKILSFAFWTGSHHPLGLKWTLSPENYTAEGWANSTYLGYSVEESCRQRHFVPHYRRENQAWILAKHLHYFSPKFKAAWSSADFDAVTAATGIKFALGSGESSHSAADAQLPQAHVNYGRINQTTFMQHLSQSRVMIGMGNPVVSPSPYDALCLGVPFINPIKDWDRGDPADKTRWQTQHNALRDLEPPYVYNVFVGDTRGFIKAVSDALANPIDSYILPRMTMAAIEQRLGAILETDWQYESDRLHIHH